jgi:hypothetical protein
MIQHKISRLPLKGLYPPTHRADKSIPFFAVRKELNGQIRWQSLSQKRGREGDSVGIGAALEVPIVGCRGSRNAVALSWNGKLSATAAL